MRQQFKEQFRKSPVGFPFAMGVVLALSGWAVYYVPWYYQNVILRPYHNFPEEVAKKLRRALFYSRGKYLDIKEANKYFRQALQVANELGMDPFSDEIMGVKYTIAALFEGAGHYALACDVLEIMRSDCQRWLDEFSDQHWNDGNRSRVKKNLVQINVKLAQLYDSKYVNEPDNAEKRLVEAVESALGEKQRREKEGVKQGEGNWMTDDEMGATLEVNNISTCLAQQTPPPASSLLSSTSSFPSTPSPPREQLVEQAHQWASKALSKAGSITPPDRNEECDIGCAVATHNLGEFCEMEGKIKEARQKYEEAASLAKDVGFAEGQTNARAGLKRLDELERGQKQT